MAEIEEDVGPGSAPPSPRAAAAAFTAATVAMDDDTVGVGDSSPSSEGSSTMAAAAPSSDGAGGIINTTNNKTPPNPLKDLMKSHKLELGLGTAVLWLYCTAFYSTLVWLPTYLTSLVPHAPVQGAFAITTVHLALVCCLFPLFGHVADTRGYYPLMLGGGVFLGATAPLAFYILRLGTPAAAFLGQLIFVVGLSAHGGALALFMTEAMTTSAHLYSAVAIAYNLAQVRKYIVLD